MKNILFILLTFLSVSFRLYAQDVIKIGIIGLDTSHSTAFTELLNGDSDDKFVKEFEVVAAYPYGSKTIQSSYERIPGYIEEVKKHGVEITSSIAELLDKVDCVMLETNDGRIHLEQAMEVFKSGKICYIDKPIGATLGQAIAIYEMAEKYNVPIFSSSALRYYTLMGTGCESVNRMSSQDADVVVGRWKDGRIGTFRGIKEGPAIYGGTAYTPKGAIAAGGYEGYKVLLDQILTFFKTGVAPISKEETIEIFTFMKASNMSKEQNGKIVTMEEAYRKGLKDAQKLIKTYK